MESVRAGVPHCVVYQPGDGEAERGEFLWAVGAAHVEYTLYLEKTAAHI